MNAPKIEFTGKFSLEKFEGLAKLIKNPVVYAKLDWSNKLIPVLKVVVEEGHDER